MSTSSWPSYHEDYGITEDEKNEVISEAKEILEVEDIIASILLVENLRIQKN